MNEVWYVVCRVDGPTSVFGSLRASYPDQSPLTAAAGPMVTLSSPAGPVAEVSSKFVYLGLLEA